MDKTKDLTGKVFDRVVVLERISNDNYGRSRWLCQCSCGNIVSVLGSSLRSKHTTSCGCKQREVAAKVGIIIRTFPEYKRWVKSIFSRDVFSCKLCGNSPSNKIVVHHIKSFSVILSENNITSVDKALACSDLWDTSNGITLCVSCHKKTHRHKEM